MTTDVVFVRHGERINAGTGDALTEAGMQAAFEAGEWLAKRGVRTAVYIHTRSVRTRQTAEQLARSVPGSLHKRAGTPQKHDPLISFCRSCETDGATLVLVGHHPTQRLVERELGGAAFEVPATNRAAAFAMRWVNGSLTCTAAFAGRPPTTN